jgi:hypothetical protein
VELKREFGHCNVPWSYEQNPQLGRWCDKQRYLLRNDNLSDERTDKLNEMGFEWNIRRKMREDICEQLPVDALMLPASSRDVFQRTPTLVVDAQNKRANHFMPTPGTSAEVAARSGKNETMRADKPIRKETTSISLPQRFKRKEDPELPHSCFQPKQQATLLAEQFFLYFSSVLVLTCTYVSFCTYISTLFS